MEAFLDRAFSRRYLPQWLVVGGVVLSIVSGFVWWTQVHESPYNVYWGMLTDSLEMTSVTKHITETSNGTNLDQKIVLNFGAHNFAYGNTTLKDATSTVKTESYGTLKADYVRYTSITSTQKDSKGKSLNFANVVGKWAKAPAANTSSASSTSAPFFVQALIGLDGGNVVPMANLSASNRQSLIRLLHQSVVFDTSFSSVKKQTLSGQHVYTYSVSIEPVAYVALEKEFASDLGIKSLQSLDPNSYESQQPIKVTFSVDVASHHLVQIGYPSTSHSETYSSYGVPIQQPTPKAAITDAQLQALLANVQ